MRQGLVFSIIVLIAFCTPVMAYDWSTNPGDGSEANPYQIGTPEQLMSIGSDEILLTKHYILTNDIIFDPDNNLSHTFDNALIAPVDFFNIYEGWISPQFSGTFDGKGYEIKNLVIEHISSEYTGEPLYLGLFGSVKDMGKIINLHLVNARIESFHWTAPEGALGALVALNWGTISNCSSTGVARTSYGTIVATGGLVALNWGVISHCSFVGIVEALAGDGGTGGLVGVNTGEISHCFFGVSTYPLPSQIIDGLVELNAKTIQNYFPEDSLVSGNYTVGGLVGWNNNGIISSCYSIGSVDGGMQTAGLVSYNENGTIENCYSMCSVDGWEGSAGLVAYNGYGSILNCYSKGSVNGNGYHPLGGLVGYNRDGIVEHSFWDINTSGCYSSNGGTGLTTWEMNDKQIFLDAGWDFVNTWWMDELNGEAPDNYPILKWQLPPTPPVADAGEDQSFFTFGDRLVDVHLDGTGSYDKYDDPLEYYWYDANELIAEGAEPNVVLGIGEHEITLIVNDGIEDSEPDTCVVTVIEPVETTAKVLPGTINAESNREQIAGRLVFTGESEPVLDPNQPMLMLIGEAEIEALEQKLVYSKKEIAWYLMASFDSAAVIEAINNNPLLQTPSPLRGTPPLQGESYLSLAGGELEITLIARFDAGQWVYGRDMVKVK